MCAMDAAYGQTLRLSPLTAGHAVNGAVSWLRSLRVAREEVRYPRSWDMSAPSGTRCGPTSLAVARTEAWSRLDNNGPQETECRALGA